MPNDDTQTPNAMLAKTPSTPVDGEKKSRLRQRINVLGQSHSSRCPRSHALLLEPQPISIFVHAIITVVAGVPMAMASHSRGRLGRLERRPLVYDARRAVPNGNNFLLPP